MFGASLLLALRAIRRHLLRSFLTVLGIVIGVAAVITMVTVGNGVTASVQSQISALGANTLMIVPDTQGRAAGSAAIRPFTTGDVEAIREQVGGVRAVAGLRQIGVSLQYEGVKWSTNGQGASNVGLDVQGLSVASGRGFTDAEETAGKAVCIIGETVRRNVFRDQDPIGKRLRVNKISCPVIGVLKKRGQGGPGGSDPDDVVEMPLRALQRQIVGDPNITYMVVGANPAYDSSAISADIERLLRERRHLGAGADTDFRMIDVKQIADTVSGTLRVMTGLVAAIASISLIVGGIGIVNIMLVSVTERTREIGIRLAIGALASEVRLQFLTEAVMLCSLGGALGIILAVGLSSLVTNLIGVELMISPYVVLGSLAFSSFLGVVFGYVPAQRAAGLNPIEALRHE